MPSAPLPLVEFLSATHQDELARLHPIYRRWEDSSHEHRSEMMSAMAEVVRVLSLFGLDVVADEVDGHLQVGVVPRPNSVKGGYHDLPKIQLEGPLEPPQPQQPVALIVPEIGTSVSGVVRSPKSKSKTTSTRSLVESPTETRRRESLSRGFTGFECTSCGSLNTKYNGTCLVCTDCGTTTGCS